ncbi:Mov34/MPN/PAD-1 family protein, partial [Vibrio parahaemolyticus]
MVVGISSELLDRLIAEAARAHPHEACGLLYGTGERIDDAEIVANVAADPARGFEIDPAALFAALRAERAGGA